MTDFDPTAPLPGPPDPWASTDQPSHRDGPPFHMTEMIAAEPSMTERILARGADDRAVRELAAAVVATVSGGDPVIAMGCGTSEHGAMAVAAILGEAVGSRLVTHAQAFELSLDPPESGLVIGISHEGGTTATNAALRAARDAGAQTALITVTQRSPGASVADIVVETHELDQSWCHTVGYLSPIAAATAIAGVTSGPAVSPEVGASLVAAGLGTAASGQAEAIAAGLAGVDRLRVVASGADQIAGRELVLKHEEGAWVPGAFRDLETFLHGHLAATDAGTGLIAIATDRRDRDARATRLRGVLAAARVIGMPTAAILSEAYSVAIDGDLTSVGRVVVPDAPEDVPAAVAALLSTATPLQLVTERLARARGIDPDPIHRDVDAYRLAADAADAAG